jgi:hypothetical protein
LEEQQRDLDNDFKQAWKHRAPAPLFTYWYFNKGIHQMIKEGEICLIKQIYSGSAHKEIAEQLEGEQARLISELREPHPEPGYISAHLEMVTGTHRGESLIIWGVQLEELINNKASKSYGGKP